MALRCKPGDLAVVARYSRVNLGKVVQCIRLATLDELNAAFYVNDRPVWVIDRPLSTRFGNLFPLAPDEMLSPLRDPGDDAIDEVIQRLGVPVSLDAVPPNIKVRV